MAMTIERACRSCGSAFLSKNGYATCSSCLYQKSRATGDPCPKCGARKDRRSKTCAACTVRVMPTGPRPQMRGPRQDASEVVARALATATPDGQCLLVTEWKPQPKGYIRAPRVDERGAQMLHRLIVEQSLGRRLVATETVDHTCHNGAGCTDGTACKHRRCANVAHMEVVDALTNWQRGTQGVVRERRERTHCPSGHPYEPGNLRAGTARGCKACHRARQAGRDPKVEPTYLR